MPPYMSTDFRASCPCHIRGRSSHRVSASQGAAANIAGRPHSFVYLHQKPQDIVVLSINPVTKPQRRTPKTAMILFFATQDTGQDNRQVIVLFIKTRYNGPESEEIAWNAMYRLLR